MSSADASDEPFFAALITTPGRTSIIGDSGSKTAYTFGARHRRFVPERSIGGGLGWRLAQGRAKE